MEPSPIGPSRALAREDAVPFAWAARLVGRALGLYVRLVSRTARVSGAPITQEQVILAVWHESNLALAAAIWRLRDTTRVVSFSTRGFRGIVMNTMLASFGSGAVTLPAEGAQTRAEAARLSREMARIGRTGLSLVIACDGPFGPYRVAKPGALIVARESGLPVQPWAIAIRPAWRLRDRWDRHLVPTPFCRMRVFEGSQLRVGAREPIKPLIAHLQAELARVADLADAWMGKRPRRATRRSLP